MTTSRRRIAAGVTALCVAVAVLAAPAPEATHASFTDSELAAGQFAALRLQTPGITAVPVCNFTLSATPLVVEWAWAQPGAPDAAAANMQWRVNGVPLTTAPPTTGPDANGRYRTSFSVGLLAGLLGTLLGTNFTLEARTRLLVGGTTTWTSATVARVDVSTGILGLNSRCPYVNGAQPLP